MRENYTNALYIIGNGFDLHHGMQTSYYNFAKYLKKHDMQLYDMLESFVHYPQSEDDLWSKFEENLANLDVEAILEDNREFLPDIASDEFRDRDLHAFPDVMGNILKNLTTDLFEIFKEFINKVDRPKSAGELKLNMDHEALYLTFNYTDTLETLYGIKPLNILHIHNSAFSDYDELILGHGIDPNKFKEEKETPPDDIDGEELEQWYQQHDDWDYSYDTGKENLLQFFAQTYKPTKIIIENNEYFFKQIADFETIYVLGHSISDVDLLYFEKIVESIHTDIKWIVSYYDYKEKEQLFNRLISIGVKAENISMIELTDIQINTFQLDIEFPR